MIIISKTLHFLRNNIFILLILTLSLITRIPYLFSRRLGSDESLYAWYASKISSNLSFIFSPIIHEFHPPLFSLYLALSSGLSESLFAYRISVMIISLLGILVIFTLGKKMGGWLAGLVSAISLSWNFLYLSSSQQIMADVPLAVALLTTLYLLINDKDNPSFKSSMLIGLAGLTCICIKWSGLIIFPLIVIQTIQSKSNKYKFLPLAIISLGIFILALNNYLMLGTILPNISAITNKEQSAFSLYYIKNIHNILMNPLLLPFLIIGIFRTIVVRGSSLIIFNFLIIAIMLISFTAVKKMDYAIMLIAPLILVSTIGITWLVEQFKTILIKRIIQILILLSFIISNIFLYQKADAILTSNNSKVTAFNNAAKHIQEINTPKTIIFSHSPRITRYYTQIDFEQHGGQIRSMPANKADFKKAISQIDNPIILELNVWQESRQEFKPFSNKPKELAYFNALDFKLSKTFISLIKQKNGQTIKIPSIKIFNRGEKTP